MKGFPLGHKINVGRVKPPTLDEFTKRFWSYVDKTNTCWLWNRSNSCQYGRVKVHRMLGLSEPKYAIASRIAWKLSGGTIPKGMFVLHRCDNPRCVRPSHLFIGNAKDNSVDCVKKLRYGAIVKPDKVLKGEQVGEHKLNNAQVIEMRKRYATGKETTTSLAKEFGVFRTTIGNIVFNRAWKHLLEASHVG